MADKRVRVKKKTASAAKRYGLTSRSKKGSAATKKKCAKAAADAGSGKKGANRKRKSSTSVRAKNSKARGVISMDICKAGTKKKGNKRYKTVVTLDSDGVKRKRYVLTEAAKRKDKKRN